MTLPSIIHGDLPGAVFDFEFYNGAIYHCCAMRATFAFDADGELDILEDQPPMMFGDYFDPDTPGAVFDNLMATAELLYPSDTTPYKPATDVLVVGTAQSKDPKVAWICELKLGQIRKRLQVTGPRAWTYSRLSGWQLSAPQATTAVPLRYDHAYGGRVHLDKAFADIKPSDLYPDNPLGRGFLASHEATPGLPYPAPQIEYPDSPIQSDPARVARVAGFSPMPPSFWQRLKLSGTYDEAWEKQVAPHIPLDMDLRYWNTAPEDQQVDPYQATQDKLTLSGFLATGDVSMELPSLACWAQVDYADGKQEVNAMWLDTVVVDLDQRHLVMRWGWITKHDPAIRRIQLACPRQDDWFAKLKQG